jgi:pimeloyl-ACP methyl ester carboxylesterase
MPARRAVLAGLAAALAAPALALPEPASPRVRRQYLDGPYGQLHLRVAQPPGGAKAPPIILLHQSPLSGRMFDRLLPHLAVGRLAIAVDTPGYGESDRPATRPSLAAYGDAILDTLTKAYGAQLDLVGYHTGAAIAADLAARRADRVRRVTLISMPFFDAKRRASMLKQLAVKTPYADDGSHLPPLWTGTFRVKPAGQSLDDVARIVAEKQRVGRHGEWALLSAMEVDFAPLLPRLRQPALVLAPHDGLEDEGAAAARLMPRAELVDMPRLAYGLFDSAPAEIAAPILAFLKR